MGDLTLTIVAILGALAWLPQIINWIIQWRTKPCLKIFSDNEAQIGFISFGSVLNINLSFLSKKKGSLIEKIELIVTGQDNSQLDLLWKYYKETFYELNGGENNSVEVGKQQKAIAINAYRDVLVEKLIMFQSSKFLENKNVLVGKLKQDITNKIAANTDINTVKGESNYNELITLIENSMFWKAGKYKGTIKVYTSENRTPSIKEINFTLSDVEIRNIKQNIELEKMLLERSYFPNQDGMNGRKWNWVNPVIS